jgi:phosphoglycolate phosphatase
MGSGSMWTGPASVRCVAMATAIIFDLDGTLADSTDCVVAAAQAVAAQAGITGVSDDAIRSRIGEPLGPMLAALFGASGDVLAQMVADYSATYVRLTATLERPFAGSTKLLEALRAQGWALAIATGKGQHGAENAMRRMGMDHHFDTIHGILPGTPGKPHPAVLQRALDALGVAAEDAIMIGDTTFDMDLSAALGVRNAAVAWGVHSAELLRGRQPDFFAKDMAALLTWLTTQHT